MASYSPISVHPSILLILLATKDGRKSCGEMIDFFRQGVYDVSLKRL
jgi:hypothetical protein